MRKDNELLRLIAVFKLFKAVTLVAVGMGALHLFHDGDAADTVTQWIAKLGFNPGGHYVDLALGKLANIPTKDFKDVGIGSFVYAALFATEGIGLWLAKRWAEWFTTIITASLIPLEVFEIHRHPSAMKVVVLFVNLGILAYLVFRIRKERPGVEVVGEAS